MNARNIVNKELCRLYISKFRWREGIRVRTNTNIIYKQTKLWYSSYLHQALRVETTRHLFWTLWSSTITPFKSRLKFVTSSEGDVEGGWVKISNSDSWPRGDLQIFTGVLTIPPLNVVVLRFNTVCQYCIMKYHVTYISVKVKGEFYLALVSFLILILLYEEG